MTNLSYQHIPIRECGDPMVDLTEYPFHLSPEYFKAGLSDTDALWTRRAIAEKLLAAQKNLPKGVTFKIWDPWRPRSVQANIYNKYWRELRAANPAWDDARISEEVGVFVTKPDDPKRVPPHATGGSIDLTLVNATTGEEIDMGTGFDHFGSEAAPDYFKNGAIAENRATFRDVMEEQGFTDDPDEWWHFDYGNQKWAVTGGHDVAIYGEVVDPTAFNQQHSQACHVG